MIPWPSGSALADAQVAEIDGAGLVGGRAARCVVDAPVPVTVGRLVADPRLVDHLPVDEELHRPPAPVHVHPEVVPAVGYQHHHVRGVPAALVAQDLEAAVGPDAQLPYRARADG